MPWSLNASSVVNWNSGPYLRKCLHAVLNQSIPIEKIIVVDNASADASLLEAEELLPHVQLIRLPRNAGFAAGNNIAVKAAEGWDSSTFNNAIHLKKPPFSRSAALLAAFFIFWRAGSPRSLLVLDLFHDPSGLCPR